MKDYEAVIDWRILRRHDNWVILYPGLDTGLEKNYTGGNSGEIQVKSVV